MLCFNSSEALGSNAQELQVHNVSHEPQRKIKKKKKKGQV